VNSNTDNITGDGSDPAVLVGDIPDSYTLTFLWSLTTTVFVIGGMIGAYSAGFVADRLGRLVAIVLMYLRFKYYNEKVMVYVQPLD